MPLEYRLTGVSRNRSTPENSTISSKRATISTRRMPRIVPLRKMFSRPVSSGWKPVPTSSSEPTRPRMTISPAVGSVMRESTFRSVLLPAPFAPMRPRTSPRRTRKLTSSRPQIRSRSECTPPERERLAGALNISVMTSRSARYGSRSPTRYLLLTRSARRTMSSDDIGEAPLDAAEIRNPADEQNESRAERDEHEVAHLGDPVAEQCPAKSLNDACHRVDADPRTDGERHTEDGPDDRRREEPSLRQERDCVLHVAVLDIQRCKPERDCDRRHDGEEEEERQRPEMA